MQVVLLRPVVLGTQVPEYTLVSSHARLISTSVKSDQVGLVFSVQGDDPGFLMIHTGNINTLAGHHKCYVYIRSLARLHARTYDRVASSRQRLKSIHRTRVFVHSRLFASFVPKHFSSMRHPTAEPTGRWLVGRGQRITITGAGDE